MSMKLARRRLLLSMFRNLEGSANTHILSNVNHRVLFTSKAVVFSAECVLAFV